MPCRDRLNPDQGTAAEKQLILHLCGLSFFFLMLLISIFRKWLLSVSTRMKRSLSIGRRRTTAFDLSSLICSEGRRVSRAIEVSRNFFLKNFIGIDGFWRPGRGLIRVSNWHPYSFWQITMFWATVCT